MKIMIVLCTLAGLALGLPEKPAPYPAKGWKPQGAQLDLPSQYGPPRDQRTKPEEIDITTQATPDNDNDALRVQGLPAADSVSQFKNYQQKTSPNTNVQQQAARIQIASAPAFIGQPFLFSPLFAPQFAPVSGQLQEGQFGQQVAQSTVEADDPKNDAQQLPAQAYGPPQTPNNVPTPRQPVPKNPQNEVQDNNDSEEDDGDDSDAPAVAVSNAESTGNLIQETQQGQVGQYYILLPDNSLQKVRFATKQTVEDREINGFSAQLRYSPVEAIKDPVYGYDEQGKLVRLYK